MPHIVVFVVKMTGCDGADAKHDKHAQQRNDACERCGIQLIH